MSNQVDLFSEKYTIDTPEHVSFGYQIAGIGNRFIAALVDSILLVVLLGGLTLLLIIVLVLVSPDESLPNVGGEELIGWAGGFVLALYALVNFVLIWGYYILFEWLWNGQTPGKRLARIRVVGMNGSPCGPVEIVIRNLVRVVDFLPVGYGVGLVSMFVDRYARRLGDFAAGTLVVKGHREINLEAVLTQSVQSATDRSSMGTVSNTMPITVPDKETGATMALEQRYAGLRRLSIADRDLVAELLYRYERGRAEDELVERVARAIAHKMGQEPPADSDVSRAFLAEVLEAYRHFEDRSSS